MADLDVHLMADRNQLLQRLEKAEAEIQRLREAQGWQPIETAPKDGTIIRVFAEHEFDPGPEQYFAYWRRDARYTSGGVWQDRDREIIVHPDATHWMPCEAAPPQEDQ